MERGITLTRYAESRAPIPNRGDGFRVYIVASDGFNVPDEIFLHRHTVKDARTGLVGNEFLAVASPDDFVLPAQDPDGPIQTTNFRLAVVDVVVPSRRDAEFVWTEVRNQVDCLLHALYRKDQLVVAESVRLGSETPADVSESLSESLSNSLSQ